ncbi:MAG: cysteine desulfurase family protein [candidate division WOR-3 bacterium]
MPLVYLDNHSATKLDMRVLEAMLPYFTEFYGNPLSFHPLGQKSEQARETARQEVANLLSVQPDEVYFTSCGSEANNWAIKGIAWAYQHKGRHIVTSKIEHVSVLNTVKYLEQQGFEVTYLDVDQYGLVDPDDLEKALKDTTILISIQHANPEIGTIQPIPELVKVAKSHGILFHTDAVASCGIIPVDANKLGVDLLSLSASTMYGPKGIGALFVKKGIKITPLIHGGIQEHNKRAGTENIPGIVGFGKACALAKAEMSMRHNTLCRLRNKLIAEIPQIIEYVYLNGHPANRLPNNINFSFEFVEGESITLLLAEKGIYVSSGSTCSSRALKMSHVLEALRIDPAVAQGTITMTLGIDLTDSDIAYVLEKLPPIIYHLRELSPLYDHFKKTGQRKIAGPRLRHE